MTNRSEQLSTHCIFEYRYRDAGNWKTHGELLLSGNATKDVSEAIKDTLDWNHTFVAEQVGIPSLCSRHFKDCGSEGPSELDHAYHEFIAIRPASKREVSALAVFGSIEEVVKKFKMTNGRWDVRLSPNVIW